MGGQPVATPPEPSLPFSDKGFSQDHEDQLKREKISTIEQLPTLYRPLSNMLMVVPLPEMTHYGGILIPAGARLAMNEGHIVAKGPTCTDAVQIGDCVTWDEHTENKLEIDGVPFVLISELVCIMCIPKAELEKAAADRVNRSAANPVEAQPEAHNSGH